MGCHTWGYKKVTALDENFKQAEVETELERLRSSWILNATKDEVIESTNRRWSDYRKEYPDYKPFSKDYTEKEYKKDINEYNNQIKRLETEGFDYLMVLAQKHLCYTAMHKHKDEYYWNISFDTPFRVYGYPENTFYSKEKLLKWLKTGKYDVGYYDGANWQPGYTEESERRICEFYKEHGEENLYFRFG